MVPMPDIVPPPPSITDPWDRFTENRFAGQTKETIAKSELRLNEITSRYTSLQSMFDCLQVNWIHTHADKFKKLRDVAFLPTSLLCEILLKEYEVAVPPVEDNEKIGMLEFYKSLDDSMESNNSQSGAENANDFVPVVVKRKFVLRRGRPSILKAARIQVAQLLGKHEMPICSHGKLFIDTTRCSLAQTDKPADYYYVSKKCLANFKKLAILSMPSTAFSSNIVGDSPKRIRPIPVRRKRLLLDELENGCNGELPLKQIKDEETVEKRIVNAVSDAVEDMVASVSDEHRSESPLEPLPPTGDGAELGPVLEDRTNGSRTVDKCDSDGSGSSNTPLDRPSSSNSAATSHEGGWGGGNDTDQNYPAPIIIGKQENIQVGSSLILTISVSLGAIENICEKCFGEHIEAINMQRYVYENAPVFVLLVSQNEDSTNSSVAAPKTTRRTQKRNCFKIKVKLFLRHFICLMQTISLFFQPLILISQTFVPNTLKYDDQRAPERGFIDTALAH
uniref:DUF4806 domain-containing protein n=1 Tax=Heterorhabditis bacteriophora TaxID=37862 RepID=A0A1I7WVJ2_HETBA